MKCVATTWDGLNERYIACTFGDMRTSIADTIVNQQKEVADKPSVSEMGKAIDTATKLITGNLGGYVVMHDSDNDGEPDEILIMDTPKISTAVNVIRMNQSGVGLSTSGYSGPYSTAITASGIVATMITSGTLNANLIKAGVIEDLAKNSQIDMTNGQATLYQLAAKAYCKAIDADTLDTLAQIRTSPNGGVIEAFNKLKHEVAQLVSTASGNGELILRKSNGTDYLAHINVNLDGGGFVEVLDANDNVTAKLTAGDGTNGGHIEQTGGCVQLWSGESYTGSIDIIGAYNKYTSYLIYGRVDTGGSLISTLIPRTMITDTNQKFILSDEAKYITFNVRYIGSDLRIDHNTKSHMGCLLKVYGIY